MIDTPTLAPPPPKSIRQAKLRTLIAQAEARGDVTGAVALFAESQRIQHQLNDQVELAAVPATSHMLEAQAYARKHGMDLGGVLQWFERLALDQRRLTRAACFREQYIAHCQRCGRAVHP